MEKNQDRNRDGQEITETQTEKPVAGKHYEQHKTRLSEATAASQKLFAFFSNPFLTSFYLEAGNIISDM